MNKKQIRRDYENIDYIDEKGKMRTKVRYRGALYSLVDPTVLTRFRALYAAIAIFGVVAYVLPLCFNIGAMRAIYFTLPYVVQVFCLLVSVMGAYKALTVTPPWREEVYHLVFRQGTAAAIAGIALSAVSLVTFIVYAAKTPAAGLDYLALGAVLVDALCYVGLFLNIRARKVDRTDPEPQEEPAEAIQDPVDAQGEDASTAVDESGEDVARDEGNTADDSVEE